MPVQKITKAEILLKSSDVFRVKGYHNTSMQDLAESLWIIERKSLLSLPEQRNANERFVVFDT